MSTLKLFQRRYYLRKARRALVLLLFLGAQALMAGPYQDGKRAFSRRDYKTAHAKFQEALRANPGYGDPLFYIGYMLENQGKKEEAMSAYGRAVGLNMSPDLKEKAYWRLVLHYRYQNDWNNLYAYASRFQSFRPGPRVAAMISQAEANRDPARLKFDRHLARAEELNRQGKMDDAIQEYLLALDQKPGYPTVRWKLALLYLQKKEYQTARTELTKLLQAEQKWEYEYKLAICNYYLGHFQEALAGFEKSDRLNTAPSSSYRSLTALGKGLVLLELRQFAEAERQLKQADQKNARVQAAMARYYMLADDMNQAIIAAHNAKKGGETHPDIEMVLGLSELARGNFERALGYLQKMEDRLLQERSPSNYATARHALAKLACHKESYSQCEGALNSYRPEQVQLQLTQQTKLIYNSKRIENEIHFYRSRVQISRGQDKDALASLARIKTDARAYFERARIHARLDEADAAEQLLLQLGQRNESYWQHAEKDALISGLARRNPGFAEFLRKRGQPGAGLPAKSTEKLPTLEP